MKTLGANAFAEVFGADALKNSTSMSKVWVVMTLISLVLIFGGHEIGRFGLLLGFLAALSVNTLVFFYADFRIDSLFEGRLLEGQDAWGLVRETRELARTLGLKAPDLVLVESQTPLAFSAGLIANRSKIYVSTELLKRLSPDEIRIVLAFELYRLKTQQTAAATAASALVSFLTFTARLIDDIVLFRWAAALYRRLRGVRSPLERHVGIVSGPMTLLVSPLVALIVRSAVGRRGVLEADREAGMVTKNGSGAVARTLWKLDSYAKTRPFKVDLAEAHLFTVSPLTRYPALAIRFCAAADRSSPQSIDGLRTFIEFSLTAINRHRLNRSN